MTKQLPEKMTAHLPKTVEFSTKIMYLIQIFVVFNICNCKIRPHFLAISKKLLNFALC